MAETAPTAVDAGPFTTNMSKKDMIAHLYQVHGVRRAPNTTWYQGHLINPTDSKATKQELFDLHTKIHEFLDGQDDEWWATHPAGESIGQPNRNGQLEYRRSYNMEVPVRHTHPAVVPGSGQDGQPTDEVQDTAKRILAGEIPDKPLPASERKIVSQLIDNEFGELKQQMREFAADALRSKETELRDEWAGRREDADSYGKDLRKVVSKAQAKLDKIVAEAKTAGVIVQNAGHVRAHFSPVVKFEGWEKAVTAAKTENKNMLDRALMTLERQRLAAQKKVLMAGMSERAADLVNSIPTARELMLEAQAEAAAAPKEIEA